MMVANNHNLFPLPYWAPALWRVPIPLQLLNEAYAFGQRRRCATTACLRSGIPPERTRLTTVCMGLVNSIAVTSQLKHTPRG